MGDKYILTKIPGADSNSGCGPILLIGAVVLGAIAYALYYVGIFLDGCLN